MNSQASPVSTQWAGDLARYLESHENDIAFEINDFAELKLVWDMFFPKPPVEHGSSIEKGFIERIYGKR